jgi:TRAP-type transport system small permease protein
MKAFANTVNKIDHFFFILAQIILVITMLFSSLDTILRYVSKSPIVGGYEIISEYMLPYLVFFAISYVFKQGEHVRVTLLIRLLSSKTREVLMFITNCLSVILIGFLTYTTYIKTFNAFQDGEYSSNVLAYPLWPAYAVLVVGYGILAIRIILTIIRKENPYLQSEAE